MASDWAVLALGGAGGMPQLAGECLAESLGVRSRECLEPDGVPPVIGCPSSGRTATEAELLHVDSGSVALFRSEPVLGGAGCAQRDVARRLERARFVVGLASAEPARMPRGFHMGIYAPDKDSLGWEGLAARLGAVEMAEPPEGVGAPLPPWAALEGLRKAGTSCGALVIANSGAAEVEQAVELARACAVALGVTDFSPCIPEAWHSYSSS